MSTVIKSTDWCPLCLLQNKVQNPLLNRAGQFYSNCQAGHQFNDTEELNLLREQARSKFPGVYQQNAAQPADPQVLAGQDIVINAEAKRALSELLGQPITSGGDLKGLIYGFVQDNKDKDSEIRSLRATLATMKSRPQSGGQRGPGPCQFLVEAPEWAMAGLAAQADDSHKTPEEWVSHEFSSWMENYFGAPVSRN